MKKLLPFALAALVAQPALAGNMAEPMIESEVIAEDAAASSGGGLLIPIFLLILFAAAASSGGSNGGGGSVSIGLE